MLRSARVGLGRTFVLVLAVVAVLADLALGGLILRPESARAATSITLMTPDANSQAQEWYTKVLKPGFEKATGITLNVIIIPDWTAYLQKLPVMFASGEAPDVFSVGGEFVGTYVSQGMLLPLNRFTDTWDGLKDMPRPAVLDGTVDGKQYTVPYRIDQRTLYYRKDIFDMVGLDPDRPPATWDELVSMGRKLVVRDAEGRYVRDALNLYPAWDLLSIFVLQNGGQLVSADGKRAGFDSPADKEALQFFIDLSQRYQIAGKDGSPWKGANSVVTGTSAMEYAGDWVLGAMAQVNPKQFNDLGVALPPKKVTRSGLLYVNKWAIASTSKAPEAAWKLIEYMEEPERRGEVSRINSFLPARLTIIRSQAPWMNDPRWWTIMQAAEQTVPLPGKARKLGDALLAMEKAVRSTLAGEKSLEQSLAEAVQQANLFLQGKQ